MLNKGLQKNGENVLFSAKAAKKCSPKQGRRGVMPPLDPLLSNDYNSIGLC